MIDDAMDVEAALPTFGMDVDVGQGGAAGVAAGAGSAVDGDGGDLPPPDAEAVAEARRTVVAFLQDHRAEEVVPNDSRVVIIDSDVRLSHAFKALLDNSIRAAPIVQNGTANFVGMFTVSDISACLRHFYYESPSRNVQLGLESHTIASWRAIRESVDGGFRFVDAEASLFDACRLLRDLRIHRLPIVATSSSLLLCTLEHWRVLRFVHQHLAGHDRPASSDTGGAMSSTAAAAVAAAAAVVVSQNQPLGHVHPNVPPADPSLLQQAGMQQQQQGPDLSMPMAPGMAQVQGAIQPNLVDPAAVDLFNLTLAQLRLGTYGNLITVRETDTLLHVLETMDRHALSAVPVVDEAMRLRNVYSRTDVTHLKRHESEPINLDQSVQDSLIPIRGPHYVVHTCRRSDTLREVFERFESTRKHRLYAVNEHGHVEGVLSLSDLLEYFLEGF